MKILEEKILSEGIAVNEDILKVDSFVNHQVDPVLMHQIGEAFAAHYKDCGVTKVVRYRSCSYDSVSAECSNDYFKETAFKGVK